MFGIVLIGCVWYDDSVKKRDGNVFTNSEGKVVIMLERSKRKLLIPIMNKLSKTRKGCLFWEIAYNYSKKNLSSIYGDIL